MTPDSPPPPAALTFDKPPAIVVGACGHSLAVMRALREGDLPVIALEANPGLPGNRTRLARVLAVPDINGPGLVDALQRLRPRIDCPGRPVLFLTNDTMVRTVGEHWQALAGHYALSWADSRAALLPLLDKPALERRCAAAGLNYPKTFVIRSAADVRHAAASIGFPMIVKPSRPLSRFKTAQPATARALGELVERLASDLPFLVQQFIPGDDTRIHFSALYLDRGRVRARFDGHKLRSRPLGHTTIAESAPDDAVFAHTCSFFDGLGLSGPVSLELKRDDHGGLWVIEPTVGRTDFWLGLCTANGVNLPLVEYHHQCATALPAMRQRDAVVWFNEDRDPTGRLWMQRRGKAGMRGRRSSFTFLHWQDPSPAFEFLRQTAAHLLRAAARRIGRSAPAASEPTALHCNALDSFQPLREHREWPLLSLASPSVFETAEWFENLDATCEAPGARTLVLAVDEPQGCSVLPVRRSRWNRVESLSNYYASLYGPAMANPERARAHAQAFAQWFAAQRTSLLRLHPVDLDTPFWRAFMKALRQQGYWVDSYFAFGNWHHPCAGTGWAAYLASRPSRLRHTIVRTRRKLGTDPTFAIRVLAADAPAPAMQQAVDDFQTVYARSWKKPEPHPSFIPSFSRLAHGKGWLRMGLCYLDGRPVAAQMWLVQAGVASIFKLAYDERYAKRGVGTVVSAALSQHVLDIDRVSEIDFLAGDDAYKSEWMACRRERRGLLAFHPRTAAGLSGAARHFGARVIRRSSAPSHWGETVPGRLPL